MKSPKISVSADGRYRTQHLTERVTVIEALGQDWNDWGNATEERPAFVAYMGAENMTQAQNFKHSIQKLLYWEEVTIRSRRDNRTGWPVELKVKGLDRRQIDRLTTWGETADYLKEARELQPA